MDKNNLSSEVELNSNMGDRDDYVFITFDDTAHCGDEDDWDLAEDDVELITLNHPSTISKNWDEEDEDEYSIALSQSPSTVTVGSFEVEETERSIVVTGKGLSVDGENEPEAVTPVLENQVLEKIRPESHVNLSHTASNVQNDVRVSIKTQSCVSRLCNKKKRKRMKQLRKALAASSAAPTSSPSVLVHEERSDLVLTTSTAKKSVSKTTTSVSSQKTNSMDDKTSRTATTITSNIPLACAFEALAAYRSTLHLQSKSDMISQRNAILPERASRRHTKSFPNTITHCLMGA